MNRKNVSFKTEEFDDAVPTSTLKRILHPENEAQNGQLDDSRVGLVCPNCGGPLEGRKCKLFCLKPGCGYLVTCSEW